MSFRPFGATDKPGTCLWYGRKLRRRHMVKREAVEGKHRPPARCTGCQKDNHDPGVLRKASAWEQIEIEDDGRVFYRCKHCGEEYEGYQKMRIAKRVSLSRKPGDYGDGFVCDLCCGYLLGVAFTQRGRRRR